MLIARKNGSLINSCTSPDGTATDCLCAVAPYVKGEFYRFSLLRVARKGEIRRGLGRAETAEVEKHWETGLLSPSPVALKHLPVSWQSPWPCPDPRTVSR